MPNQSAEWGDLEWGDAEWGEVDTGAAEEPQVIDDHAFAGGLTIYRVSAERWG